MKKVLKKLLFSVTIICLIFSIIAFADVGNFNDYDSGGWDSGGWDSYDSYDSYDYWDDNDYDSNSSSSGEPVSMTAVVVFIIIIVVISILTRKKGGNASGNTSNYRQTTQQVNLSSPKKTQEIGNEIRKTDEFFSEEKFLSYVQEVFVKLQTAWSARQWDTIRIFETNELFNQHKLQLQQYIDNGKINVMDRISVRYSELIQYSIQSENEVIEVELHASMKDYVINDKTQELIEGNKDKIWNMRYILTFIRKKGVKTKQDDKLTTTACPNCGAPTTVTSAGECEYCKSIIVNGEHGWVLSNLRGIK